MKESLIIFLFILAMLAWSCQPKPKHQVNMDNLYAWCIVPFDAKERRPLERIEMLKRLGFNKYAYDWRSTHLDEMAEEFKLAQQNNIEIIAVWMWLDATVDQIRALSQANERVLATIAATGLETRLWVCFHPNFFAGLTDAEAVIKGAEMIGYIGSIVQPLGCQVALYNHGDWFGDPKNQIKIIQALPDQKIGLVYNFHHAHSQLDDYAENLALMMPYLWNVNLNGMRKDGPQILPIGQGTLEREMIQLLLHKGYQGPFGILGHVENADVEKVLDQNLVGLDHLSLGF